MRKKWNTSCVQLALIKRVKAYYNGGGGELQTSMKTIFFSHRLWINARDIPIVSYVLPVLVVVLTPGARHRKKKLYTLYEQWKRIHDNVAQTRKKPSEQNM